MIGFGLLFFAIMFTGGKQAAGFAIPGSIISGTGLVLLIQNLTHHWESMSYFWALIIMFVGTGIYIMGWHSEDANQKQSGLRVMKAGFILFIIFGAFFEIIFSSFSSILFPVLLIGLGLFLVMTRSNLLGKKNSSEVNGNDPLPPA